MLLVDLSMLVLLDKVVVLVSQRSVVSLSASQLVDFGLQLRNKEFLVLGNNCLNNILVLDSYWHWWNNGVSVHDLGVSDSLLDIASTSIRVRDFISDR